MRRRTRKRLALTTCGAVAAIAALLACGSRTGLLADEALLTGNGDAAGVPDGPRRVPSNFDSGPDALPLIDARPKVDVQRNDCPDADATLVYVVTEQNNIYSFYPAGGTFTLIGNLTCPAPAGSTPFSMAVDRKGKAYVVFNNQGGGPGTGFLYQVSTLTGACIRAPFQPNQMGVSTFGMGFASDDNGPAETLYIASSTAGTGGGTAVLGRIDISTFDLRILGAFSPAISDAELTGTGDGRLFAFYRKNNGSAIAQIDKATGTVFAESQLPSVVRGSGWAFAFWGGDFYTFTSPAQTSTVTRFRPSDDTVTVVASLNENIVGAGVSTCAPE